MQRNWTERPEVLERLFLGFEGAVLTDELASLLNTGLVGVAIYPRNFRNPDELLALTDAIRKEAAAPVLIGIDQEGGTRFSLPEPFTQWPSPAELGSAGDSELTAAIAEASARELCAAGINLNFAPMLDLATNPVSPVTQGRSFSADAAEAARLGSAFLRGLEAGGVLACAKHFPGHGDAEVDPHFDLPRFDGTYEQLMRRELLPFSVAIQTGVPLVMTAHILLPNVDALLPASLSPLILQGLLRQELKFDGIILADDLGMGAIAKQYEPGESVVRTLQAGADIAMLCHDWPSVEIVGRALGSALSKGQFSELMWTSSSSRIARLRVLIAGISQTIQPVSVIGCSDHRKLAVEARTRANG